MPKIWPVIFVLLQLYCGLLYNIYLPVIPLFFIQVFFLCLSSLFALSLFSMCVCFSFFSSLFFVRMFFRHLPLLFVCISLSLSVNHSTMICNERENHPITHFHLIPCIKKYSPSLNYLILLQFFFCYSCKLFSCMRHSCSYDF